MAKTVHGTQNLEEIWRYIIYSRCWSSAFKISENFSHFCIILLWEIQRNGEGMIAKIVGNMKKMSQKSLNISRKLNAKKKLQLMYLLRIVDEAKIVYFNARGCIIIDWKLNRVNTKIMSSKTILWITTTLKDDKLITIHLWFFFSKI